MRRDGSGQQVVFRFDPTNFEARQSMERMLKADVIFGRLFEAKYNILPMLLEKYGATAVSPNMIEAIEAFRSVIENICDGIDLEDLTQ